MPLSTLRTFRAKWALSATTPSFNLLSISSLQYIHMRSYACVGTLSVKDKYVKPYLRWAGSTVEFLIRSMESRDWDAVHLIYREGLATGQATFETAAPTADEWDSSHLSFGRIGAYEVPD